MATRQTVGNGERNRCGCEIHRGQVQVPALP